MAWVLLSSSTFQVVKCAQVTMAVSRRGATIVPRAPKGVARCLFGCCGLDSHLGQDGGAHAACVPLPGAALTQPMTQPWQPFLLLGIQKPALASCVWSRPGPPEGGFLARVTTPLFCPALS